MGHACGRRELRESRHSTDRCRLQHPLGDHGADANVEAEDRRAALLSYANRRLTGWFVGATLAWGCVQWIGPHREALGEAAFQGIFWPGALASLLVPYVLVECFASRDPRLYCAQCHRILAGIRAMHQLNKRGTCRYCGTPLPIAKPTRHQTVSHLVFIYGGMLMVLLLMWLTK